MSLQSDKQAEEYWARVLAERSKEAAAALNDYFLDEDWTEAYVVRVALEAEPVNFLGALETIGKFFRAAKKNQGRILIDRDYHYVER